MRRLIFLILFSPLCAISQTIDLFPSNQYLLHPEKQTNVNIFVYTTTPLPKPSYNPPLIVRNEYGERLKSYGLDLQKNVVEKDSMGLIKTIYKKDWQGNIVLIKR